IGKTKAAAIIQYRMDYGPFQSIEELKNVTGIGEKTFESLEDFIEL
ncbi:competence protein ComEA, partial [Turicibacter sanguinis]|nr:competence protein ComEA [Turicibacter sanguinis]